LLLITIAFCWYGGGCHGVILNVDLAFRGPLPIIFLSRRVGYNYCVISSKDAGQQIFDLVYFVWIVNVVAGRVDSEIPIRRNDERTYFVLCNVFEAFAGHSEYCKTVGKHRTTISENIQYITLEKLWLFHGRFFPDVGKKHAFAGDDHDGCATP